MANQTAVVYFTKGGAAALYANAVADVLTTVYKQMGIVADKELMAPGARPVEIIDGGAVIPELIG